LSEPLNCGDCQAQSRRKSHLDRNGDIRQQTGSIPFSMKSSHFAAICFSVEGCCERWATASLINLFALPTHFGYTFSCQTLDGFQTSLAVR
jgi:hypothetical protein